MNITFLIGNGFDLGVGMKSKFSHYFPIYIEESKNKKTSLRGLADNISMNEDKWSYFEKQLGEYTTNFTSDNKLNFRNQLRDFERSFVDYLKKEEQLLSFENHKDISNQMISALTTFYLNGNLHTASSNMVKKLYESNRGQHHRYNFISFNYTSVLDNCLITIENKHVKKRQVGTYTYNDIIGEIVHVHGNCDNFPITGVNDVSQIKNEELAKDDKFVRYLVKPMINNRLRMNYDLESSRLIANSSIVCIYGMALGETDKKWWDKILSWLNSNSDHQLIIFDYDENYTTTSQFDWLDKEDSILEKLQAYSSNKDINIDKLRERIHISVNKNIFEMNLKMDVGEIKDLIYTSEEVIENVG